MISLVTMVAGLAIGMFMGGLLMSVYTHALVSRAQQRMQQIVLHWQSEAARMRAEVERLTRQWPGAANPPIGPWGG
jgi:CelD/BcsL family acetyltransferase involved in cellulose biosynthesis